MLYIVLLPGLSTCIAHRMLLNCQLSIVTRETVKGPVQGESLNIAPEFYYRLQTDPTNKVYHTGTLAHQYTDLPRPHACD